jgi:hypothetical protein
MASVADATRPVIAAHETQVSVLSRRPCPDPLLEPGRPRPATTGGDLGEGTLAGAALEELLRSLVITHSATVVGRRGLQAYSEALRPAGVLTPQDVKDVTSWAGLRNSAAHGEFDDLSLERAHVMAEGVNLFMR